MGGAAVSCGVWGVSVFFVLRPGPPAQASTTLHLCTPPPFVSPSLTLIPWSPPFLSLVPPSCVPLSVSCSLSCRLAPPSQPTRRRKTTKKTVCAEGNNNDVSMSAVFNELLARPCVPQGLTFSRRGVCTRGQTDLPESICTDRACRDFASCFFFNFGMMRASAGRKFHEIPSRLS